MTTNGTPKPGDLVVHKDGEFDIIKSRKSGAQATPGGSFQPGWWLARHGGLSDRALDGPDWRHIPAEDVRAWAFAEGGE